MSEMMRQLGWRSAWERITDSLFDHLVNDELDVDAIVALLRERQTLLMAQTDEGGSPLGDAELASWLKAMLVKQRALENRAAVRHAELGRALQSLIGNARVRDRFAATEGDVDTQSLLLDCSL